MTLSTVPIRTANAIYLAGSGGYPVGDLNWFPTRYTAWKSDPVSGVETPGGEVPEAFTLAQNYPNPFNPSTQIAFGLPNTARVTLEVYNLLGQKVATLLDEMREPGSYTVSFDGKGMSSGVYFYRLTRRQSGDVEEDDAAEISRRVRKRG